MWPALLMFAGSMMGGAGNAAAAAGSVKQARYASQINNYAASYTRARAEYEATKLERMGQQVISAQRASAAASGFQPGQGTNLDIQLETEILNEIDVAMVRQAGSMESLQFEVMGRQQMAAGYGQASALYARGANSLLSGAYYFTGGKQLPFSTTESPLRTGTTLNASGYGPQR